MRIAKRDPPTPADTENSQLIPAMQNTTESDQQLHQQTEEGAIAPADLQEYNESTIQRKGELRGLKKTIANDTIAHQTGNESIDSTQKDTTTEEMDTKMSPLHMEGNHDDTQHTPKKTKKMKIERTGESQPERVRNVTRRTAQKSGKT